MLVPPEIRKCVVFLAIQDKTGLRLIGTGFFVQVQPEGTASDLGLNFIYLVSARHVIERGIDRSVDKNIYIRINQKDGEATWAKSEAAQWKFHPDDMAIDVAAMPWAPDPTKFDFLCIPPTMAALDEVIEREAIGVGDEVFLTGLFSSHFGKERNIPIIRIGNIAAMPEEKIETGIGAIDAFLVEARSIGSLSGSPVFVHLSGVRQGNLRLGNEPVFWLGLMHGHWDAKVRADDTFDVDLFDGEKVNMGIAIVVPVTKILETIEQKDFSEMQERVTEERKKGNLPTADSLDNDSEENPSKQKGDFFVERPKAEQGAMKL